MSRYYESYLVQPTMTVIVEPTIAAGCCAAALDNPATYCMIYYLLRTAVSCWPSTSTQPPATRLLPLMPFSLAVIESASATADYRSITHILPFSGVYHSLCTLSCQNMTT
jgi:hypothetical protein